MDSSTEENSELNRQIAKGGGISFLGQGLGKVLKLLFQVLLTRVLGPAGYGIYALGYNVLGLTRTLSSLGLHNGLLRFGSAQKGSGQEDKLKGTIVGALALTAASSVLAAALLYIFAQFISNFIFSQPKLVGPLKVFAVSLPFYSLITVSAFSARAFKRIDYDVGLRFVLHPLGSLLGAGLAFLLGFGLLGAVWGFTLSAALSAVVGLYLLYKLFPSILSLGGAIFQMGKLFRYSITVLLMGVSSLLLMRADRFILGAFSSAEQLGIYNVAAVVAVQTTVVYEAFKTIFSPIISDLYNKGNLGLLEKTYKNTSKWTFTLTLPVVILAACFSRPILNIFGSKFSQGWLLLIILTLAQATYSGIGSFGPMLYMAGAERTELANNLILAALNVGLNLLFVRAYGALGVAIATAISITLISLVRLVQIYRYLGIHPYKYSYWKPLLSGMVALSLWALFEVTSLFGGPLWLVEALLVTGVYFAGIWVLGLEEEDLQVLRSVKRRLGME